MTPAAPFGSWIFIPAGKNSSEQKPTHQWCYITFVTPRAQQSREPASRFISVGEPLPPHPPPPRHCCGLELETMKGGESRVHLSPRGRRNMYLSPTPGGHFSGLPPAVSKRREENQRIDFAPRSLPPSRVNEIEVIFQFIPPTPPHLSRLIYPAYLR